MLTAFIKFGDGTYSTDTSVETLKRALRDEKSCFWLDMNEPTDAEYALLKDVFGFHPLAIEDAVGHVQRPKIESYNHTGDSTKHGYFYMVIHGPDLATFKEQLRTKELDMFVAERYLVTIHDEKMKSLQEVLGRCKADPKVVLEPGIDLLLHSILDHLVDHYEPILEYLGDELDALEDEASDCPTRGLVQKISARKRELLTLRRVIGPQREVLAQLTRGEVPFIRESTRVYLRDVLDHLNRAVESLELYRDLVQGVRDIYMSSISNNLNQIMKTLTIISVIAMPLSVVTSFFGMNFDEPFFHDHKVFIGAMIFMGCAITTMLFLFHRKRWI
jgi:magnesium transporter